MPGESEKDMNEIKCTIWKIGSGCYRITVNDIRCRSFDTACISDIDILFACMEEIREALKKEFGAEAVFKTLDQEE